MWQESQSASCFFTIRCGACGSDEWMEWHVRQLTAAGLYEDEASSLAELWKKELFGTTGLHVFYRRVLLCDATHSVRTRRHDTERRCRFTNRAGNRQGLHPDEDHDKRLESRAGKGIPAIFS